MFIGFSTCSCTHPGHFNIILPSTTGSYKCPLPHPKPVWISPVSLRAYRQIPDVLAKKGANIPQTYIRETPYHSITLHFKHAFRSVYRHELETRISHKPWTQELSKVTDWPRRRAVAEFRLCVRHDCLGAHLHRIGIHPDPYCTLCSFNEPMDRNHLGQCTALNNKTECEQYWEARTKMMEN